MKKFFILSLFCFLLSSCTFNTDIEDNNGSLVVRNQCDNSSVEISEVYVMKKGGSGYNLVFSGSIENDKAHFIELESGEYSVKVAVSLNLYDMFYTVKYYDTGYNIFKKIDDGCFLNVVFDGNGIYFE